MSERVHTPHANAALTNLDAISLSDSQLDLQFDIARSLPPSLPSSRDGLRDYQQHNAASSGGQMTSTNSGYPKQSTTLDKQQQHFKSPPNLTRMEHSGSLASSIQDEQPFSKGRHQAQRHADRPNPFSDPAEVTRNTRPSRANSRTTVSDIEAVDAQSRIQSARSSQISLPYGNRHYDVSTKPPFAATPNSYSSAAPQKREFRSYLLTGNYDRPWTADKRMGRVRRSNWIVWAFILLALPVAAFLNYRSVQKASMNPYCLVLDEKFSSIDSAIWNQEVQLNGFGNGAFDWTTSDSKNVFTDSEGLHIVPTLTTESTSITNDQLMNGFKVNLTKADGDGSCTSTASGNQLNLDCAVASNSTLGQIIPPIRSARLNTKGKKAIKYGRVEVVAKMPAGDWLWPAIWMMPEEDTYGPWPASGEIDIMESRGNDVSYPMGGKDTFSGTLHWGPTGTSDEYWRTHKERHMRRTDLTKGYHTYGLEWNEKKLFTYIDNRLQTVLAVNFDKFMWDRGQFNGRMENQSLLMDPWTKTGHKNAPFDQKFFLILNVAVGGRNGFFKDGLGGKPWVDASPNARTDFYKAKDKWFPSWGKGNDAGMTVKSVKMWQEGKC